MPRQSINFTDAQKARLDALAAKTDRSVNYHVRKAVDAYLKKMGKGKKL